METFIVIMVLILIVAIIIAVKGTAGNTMRTRKVNISKPLANPHKVNSAASQYISLFNEAWSYQLESKISQEILKEFPHISANDLPGLWYELKKYLFLASLVKNLPMFSNDVDLVWHEFLEHEDEYNSFCLKFCGHIIEHHPHDKPKHLPKERALFDILYRGMFHISDSNHYWGSFFSEKKEAIQWADLIEKDMNFVLDSTHNRKTTMLGKKVYRDFLEFGQREIKKSNTMRNISNQNDGLLPYSLLAMSGFLYMDDTEEISKKKAYPSDTSYTPSYSTPIEKKDQNHEESDTNSHGDNNGNDNSSSDSGSTSSCSTSSCSSCSSCSS